MTIVDALGLVMVALPCVVAPPWGSAIDNDEAVTKVVEIAAAVSRLHCQVEATWFKRFVFPMLCLFMIFDLVTFPIRRSATTVDHRHHWDLRW